MPDSYLSRRLNFVNRSNGSKVIKFAVYVVTRALFQVVTFEPMARFTKLNFLDRLESGTEHFSVDVFTI